MVEKRDYISVYHQDVELAIFLIYELLVDLYIKESNRPHYLFWVRYFTFYRFCEILDPPVSGSSLVDCGV